MSGKLPDLSRAGFAESLRELSPEPLSERSVEGLYSHYQELRRWNERLALIGPGTLSEVLTRHYGESLAALPLVPTGARLAVDAGSGAGFPGFILAAARAEMAMTFVEPREKKWSFLLAASRKAALPCTCLNARVANPLPEGLPERIDLFTVRALKLGREVLQAVAERLAPGGAILLWTGDASPELGRDLELGRMLKLPGSERRRILELRLPGAAARTSP